MEATGPVWQQRVSPLASRARSAIAGVDRRGTTDRGRRQISRRAASAMRSWDKPAGAARGAAGRRIAPTVLGAARHLSARAAYPGRGRLRRKAAAVAGFDVAARAACRIRRSRCARRGRRRQTLTIADLAVQATGLCAAWIGVHLAVVAAIFVRTDTGLPWPTGGSRASTARLQIGRRTAPIADLHVRRGALTANRDTGRRWQALAIANVTVNATGLCAAWIGVHLAVVAARVVRTDVGLPAPAD
jgi:hypothetical protein